jgi:guanylate kinase
MIPNKKSAVLLVVSAPSGTGKTTLCERLLREVQGIHYSVSCTTRPPRAGEVDGDDYHFLSEDAFKQHAERGDFLECAEVHGAMYGTLKKDVQSIMAKGLDVLMDIDVQGAALLRGQVEDLRQSAETPIRYADVFIAPPSLEILESRLRGRGLDQEDVIRMRLSNAEEETYHCSSFDYLIVNEKLDESFDALRSILVAERHRLNT